ncbi:hypothetical protein ACQJBY_052838 [Aegilops geniculata]
MAAYTGSQLVMSHGKGLLLSSRSSSSSVGRITVTPLAAQVARVTRAVQHPPPAPVSDGPRPDGSWSTLQVGLANTTDQTHTGCGEPPCGDKNTYSSNGTVMSVGASQDSKAEENGSTRPKRKRKPNSRLDTATWEL